MLNQRIMHMVYSLGGAVVILGALFKILHWKLGPISGSSLLAAGLITEALIFALSAFEKEHEEFDWSLVYPELRRGGADQEYDDEEVSAGKKNDIAREVEGRITERLDRVLEDAKIDSKLLTNLSKGIKNLETLSDAVLPSISTVTASDKYVKELSKVTEQVQNLSSVYYEQVQEISKQKEVNHKVSETIEKIGKEMNSFEENLSQLNNVYGGMLGAMKN